MSLVFLGGTCADSTWRSELSPALNVNYFNPQVDDWTPEAKAEEDEAKARSTILLYVIDRMGSVYSFAEAVDSAHTKRALTILHILPTRIMEQQRVHVEAICTLVRNAGGIAYVDEDIHRSSRLINAYVDRNTSK